MAMGPGDDFDRDILDIIPERYDSDADSMRARAGYRVRTFLILVVAVGAVGGMVAAGWHFLGDKPVGGPGIPVIKADERPVKTRPDERGGMQVPNQDKLVYERMEAGDGSAPVERLLPPPEQPMLPPRFTSAPEPSRPVPATEIIRPPQMAAPKAPEPEMAARPAESRPVARPVEAPALPSEPPPPKPAAQPPVASQPLPPPAASGGYQPVQSRAAPAPQVAATPTPAPQPEPARLAAGDYLIQLGALRAQDAAEREWSRIAKANTDLLGSLKPDIVRVELGEKGTFWRLRAGPLSEQAARQLCGQLKERNQGCIIARK